MKQLEDVTKGVKIQSEYIEVFNDISENNENESNKKVVKEKEVSDLKNTEAVIKPIHVNAINSTENQNIENNCKECRFEGKTIKELQLHMKTKHKFKCENCDTRTETKQLLKKHIQNTHRTNIFLCPKPQD